MAVRESTFTVEADQWAEHGYIYRDGQVMHYETDRKEQTHVEFSSKPVCEFIADESLPAEIRDWARNII